MGRQRPANGRSGHPFRRARRRSRQLAAARSAAANGASGGATRAQPASLWICASVALTPDTSGLPSNSLRIVTARSSAAASPLARLAGRGRR